MLLIAALAASVLAWAGAFVVIRGVGPFLDPGALSLGRLVVGTVALGILLLVRRRWVPPTRREWLQLVLFGVAWFAVYNLALNAAELTLDAGTASVIVNIGPIFIALGAGVLLGEGFPRWVVIGTLVAFAGVVLIGVGSVLAQEDAHPLDILGALLALAAAATYAIGVLAQKPVVARIPAIQATFLGCVIGMLACLPWAGALISQLADAPVSAWLGVLYLGVIATAVAFSTWGFALKHLPASQVGISTYLVPPIATLMGFLAFREVPHPVALVGGVICLIGVALSRRKPVVREQVAAGARAD